MSEDVGKELRGLRDQYEASMLAWNKAFLVLAILSPIFSGAAAVVVNLDAQYKWLATMLAGLGAVLSSVMAAARVETKYTGYLVCRNEFDALLIELGKDGVDRDAIRDKAAAVVRRESALLTGRPS